jgi:pyroglutamyl-peptidase
MDIAIVTGFQPFGEHTINPSQQVAEQLDGYKIGKLKIFSCILPVVFDEDIKILFPLIQDLQPKLVLSLGLGMGNSCLRVERLAVNLRIANDNKQIPIIQDGPAAYFATIDVDFISQIISSKGSPAQPNVYAGNYLCNHIMYQTLHFCAVKNFDTKVGFIHLPLSLEQTIIENRIGCPALPLKIMKMGILNAIKSSFEV